MLQQSRRSGIPSCFPIKSWLWADLDDILPINFTKSFLKAKLGLSSSSCLSRPWYWRCEIIGSKAPLFLALPKRWSAFRVAFLKVEENKQQILVSFFLLFLDSDWFTDSSAYQLSFPVNCDPAWEDRRTWCHRKKPDRRSKGAFSVVKVRFCRLLANQN